MVQMSKWIGLHHIQHRWPTANHTELQQKPVHVMYISCIMIVRVCWIYVINTSQTESLGKFHRIIKYSTTCNHKLGNI